MIISKREGIPLKEMIIQISRIAQLEGSSWEVFYKSCEYIEKGATIFDSLLMASCSSSDAIISSDTAYNKFGYKVIDLKNG